MPSSPVAQFFHNQYVSVSSNLDFGFKNPNRCLSIASLIATYTASANQTDACTSSNAQAICVGIKVGTVSGTTPTLVANLQTSATFGGSYTTIASSATITATGTYYFFAQPSALSPPSEGNFWRISFTVGGTTPSFQVLGVAAQLFYIDNSTPV